MKELQIIVKAPDTKDFEAAIKYVLYQVSSGVRDDKMEFVSDGDGVLKVEFKLWEDLNEQENRQENKT